MRSLTTTTGVHVLDFKDKTSADSPGRNDKRKPLMHTSLRACFGKDLEVNSSGHPEKLGRTKNLTCTHRGGSRSEGTSL